MDYIVIMDVRSGTGVCTSQYGFYCDLSYQVVHWSIVRLSIDSIVIIAVRSGTGVLYVSVWIIL